MPLVREFNEPTFTVSPFIARQRAYQTSLAFELRPHRRLNWFTPSLHLCIAIVKSSFGLDNVIYPDSYDFISPELALAEEGFVASGFDCEVPTDLLANKLISDLHQFGPLIFLYPEDSGENTFIVVFDYRKRWIAPNHQDNVDLEIYGVDPCRGSTWRQGWGSFQNDLPFSSGVWYRVNRAGHFLAEQQRQTTSVRLRRTLSF